MTRVIVFSVEALAQGDLAESARFAAQVTEACAEALENDESTYLLADGTAVAIIGPLPPEEG